MSGGVGVRPDFDGGGGPDRPVPKESTAWNSVAVVVVIAVLGAMIWLLVDARHRAERIEDHLVAMESDLLILKQNSLPTPNGEPPPPVDLRSDAEREAERLASIQIVDTIDQLFDPNRPPGAATALMAERPEVADRLRSLNVGKCREGRPVVTDITFTDPDNAIATYWFDGIEMAAGFEFAGGFRRIDGRWLAMPDAVDNVVDTAGSFCASS
jgi:hypothetical protein